MRLGRRCFRHVAPGSCWLLPLGPLRGRPPPPSLGAVTASPSRAFVSLPMSSRLDSNTICTWRFPDSYFDLTLLSRISASCVQSPLRQNHTCPNSLLASPAPESNPPPFPSHTRVAGRLRCSGGRFHSSGSCEKKPRRPPRFSRFSRLRGHHVVRSGRPFLSSVFWIPSPLATVTAAVTSPRDVACPLDDREGFLTGVPALSCLPCGPSSKERPAESSPILRGEATSPASPQVAQDRSQRPRPAHGAPDCPLPPNPSDLLTHTPRPCPRRSGQPRGHTRFTRDRGPACFCDQHHRPDKSHVAHLGPP